MKRRTGWVVVGGKGGAVGECKRCGAVLESALPMPLYLAAAMMEAFVKLHKDCKAPVIRKGPALRAKAKS